MFGRNTETPDAAAPAPRRSLADEVSMLYERAVEERHGLDNTIATLEERLTLTRDAQAKTSGIEQSLAAMLTVN